MTHCHYLCFFSKFHPKLQFGIRVARAVGKLSLCPLHRRCMAHSHFWNQTECVGESLELAETMKRNNEAMKRGLRTIPLRRSLCCYLPPTNLKCDRLCCLPIIFDLNEVWSLPSSLQTKTRFLYSNIPILSSFLSPCSFSYFRLFSLLPLPSLSSLPKRAY